MAVKPLRRSPLPASAHRRWRVGSDIGQFGEPVAVGLAEGFALAPDIQQGAFVIPPAAIGIEADLDAEFGDLEGVIEKRLEQMPKIGSPKRTTRPN